MVPVEGVKRLTLTCPDGVSDTCVGLIIGYLMFNLSFYVWVLWGELSVVGIAALVPILAVVFVLQRHIVRGRTMGHGQGLVGVISCGG